MPEGSEQLDDIRGVRLDLDGTVFIGDRLVPGAADAIAVLRRGGVPLRFRTTTTRMSRTSLVERLRRMGVEFEAAEPLTAEIITSTPPYRLCWYGAHQALSVSYWLT